MSGSDPDNPQSQEHSSDWFSSDPALYIQALDEFEQTLARKGYPEQTETQQEVTVQEIQPPSTVHKRSHNEVTGDYLDSDTYGAATFGDFGEYMARKRAKLQIQNQNLTSGPQLREGSQIFRAIAIYVRGGSALQPPSSRPADGM